MFTKAECPPDLNWSALQSNGGLKNCKYYYRIGSPVSNN